MADGGEHRTTGGAGPRARPRDLDMDAATSAHNVPGSEAPEAYLRIVANPFLALSALIAWVMLPRLVSTQGNPNIGKYLVIFWLTLLVPIPRLIQYHCLDCGRTGRYKLWRQHVCPRVVERRVLNRPRRFRGPAPIVQLGLWLGLFVVLALVTTFVGRL